MSSFTPSRRRSVALMTLLGLFVGLFFAPFSARAVNDLGFELDGNTDAPASDVDWESFFDAAGANVLPRPANFTATGFAADYALPDLSTYATGSKDTLHIGPYNGQAAGWQCTKSNNIGDKVDIVNAYAAAYVDPSTDDLVLYFGVEKSSPNGDSSIGVWFLKDPDVGCKPKGNGGTNFTGQHQDGDIFVVSEFTNGGGTASVKAYKWQGGAGGSLNPNPVAEGGICPAAGSPDADDQRACATVNRTSVDTTWASPDKNGGDLDALEFFEGGVNLGSRQAAGCFASYVANTRSSQSLTATIFDFDQGSLPVCRPSTALSASASAPTIHGGDSVTLTFNEHNDGDVGLTNVRVTTDYTGCAPAYVSGDTANAGVLDPGETWKFTCTFTPTATVTVTADGHGIDFLGNDITYPAYPAERAKVTVTVIKPNTVLKKTASANVTYSYSESNTGDVVLDPPTAGDRNSVVTDDKCAPVTYVSGDTDGDKRLDPAETWNFTCTATIAGPTTATGSTSVTNVATGSGIDPLGRNITYPAYPTERDSVTVSITNH